MVAVGLPACLPDVMALELAGWCVFIVAVGRRRN